MRQTVITQRERKTLVRHYLKEIEKQLQSCDVEHLQYFSGKLTVHNLKLLEKFLELDFEYSQSTERVYLRDAPYSYIDLDDIDLPEIVKCIAIEGKTVQDYIDETGYKFDIIHIPDVTVEYPNLLSVFNCHVDYVRYKKENKQYLLTTGEELRKDREITINMADISMLVSKTEMVMEEVPLSPPHKRFGIRSTKPIVLPYAGPQLAGMDDAKWYRWTDELKHRVVPMALQTIVDAITRVANNHAGITTTELIKIMKEEEHAIELE